VFHSTVCISQEHAAYTGVPDLNAFPTTLFIDREGKVRARHVGYRDYATLEAITKVFLEGAGAKDEPKKDEPKRDGAPKKQEPF
jgi:hypothetical protein